MLNEFNDDNEIIMPGSICWDREGHRTRSLEAPDSIPLLVLLSVTNVALKLSQFHVEKRLVACNKTMLIV